MTARADLADLPLYEADRRPALIDLSDNTNRWGMPPSAARALCEAPPTSFVRYPEPYADSLKEALATYCGVEPANIVTGCGSDDVLDAAIRAFVTPGGSVATCDPSFVVIPALARLSGAPCVRVPFTAGFDADADALRDSGASVIYLCTPNNPTGTETSPDTVGRLADAAAGLVIVDEAYAEFTDRSCIELARTRPNVLVARTMSKAFGLAGLRVGYGIGAPEVVRTIAKARGPYKVSAAGSLAAQAALRDDVAWMREHARLARAARVHLARELEARGITTLPSAANFVFAPVTGARRIAQRMHELGVAVRAFSALPRFGDALRITVGPPGEIAAALAALEQARAECA
jgi:histidinol-phosphate aminotransferase